MVLTLPGWRRSKGVQAEIKAWKEAGHYLFGRIERNAIRYVDSHGLVTTEPGYEGI